jgi:CHAD domain-containing protein
MDDSTRLDDALREEVKGRLQKLEKRLKKAHAGKTKGVHDSRTELRRIRAELDTMGHTAFDGRATSRACARLHAVERSLAKARDTDVLLEHLAAWMRGKHRDTRALDEVGARLARRRRRAIRRARVMLDGRAREGLVHTVLDAIRRKNVVVHQPKNAARAAPELVRHFTHAEVWRRYESMRAFDARLPADIETLHKLRSACRELRFTLEAFEDAFPALDPIARELHARQDEIGELHDHEIAIELLERWRSQEKIAPSHALDAYLAARAKARDELRRRLEQRWLGVLHAQFRLRLARALEGARVVHRAAA